MYKCDAHPVQIYEKFIPHYLTLHTMARPAAQRPSANLSRGGRNLVAPAVAYKDLGTARFWKGPAHGHFGSFRARTGCFPRLARRYCRIWGAPTPPQPPVRGRDGAGRSTTGVLGTATVGRDDMGLPAGTPPQRPSRHPRCPAEDGTVGSGDGHTQTSRHVADGL